MTIRQVCILFVVCRVGSGAGHSFRRVMPCVLARNVNINVTGARFGLLRCGNKNSYYDLPGYDAVSCSSRRTAVSDDTLLTSPGFMWAKLGKCQIMYNWCETDGSHKIGVANQLKLYPQTNFEPYNQCQQDLLQDGAHYLCLNWPDCVMINCR